MPKKQQQSFTARSERLGRLIAQPGQGFFIPEYQRPYSWGRDDISRLFEDLSYAAEKVIRDEDRLTFLGSLILVDGFPVPADDTPARVRQLIDGQQRVATILVLGTELSRSLRDLQKTVAPKDPIFNVAEQVANQLRRLSVLETQRPPVEEWPRLIRSGDLWSYQDLGQKYESDIALLLKELAVDGKDTSTIDADSPLGAAHRAIQEGIEELASGSSGTDLDQIASKWTSAPSLRQFCGIDDEPLNDNDVRLRRLVIAGKTLLERVEVIEVEAPDEDYAFSLFEPLNTTGQLLTALETLKPKIVQLENSEAGGFTGSLSAQALDEIESVVGAKDPDEKTARTADLVTVFALAETGEKLGHRLAAQRAMLRQLTREATVEQARDSVETLRRVAVFQRDVWEDDELRALSSFQDSTWVAMRFLSDSKHRISRALLARYYAAYQENQSLDFARLVRAVAAFWFLWRASRSTTGGIDTHYRTLMADGWPADTGATAGPVSRLDKAVFPKLQTRTSLPSIGEIIEALRAILASKGRITDKDDWVNATSSINVYGGKAIEEFGLLVAHHDALPDASSPTFLVAGNRNSKPTVTKEYWNTPYTTEHIAPQQPRAGDNTYDQDIYTKATANRWGNLTLVPHAENASLSNRSWPEKRQIYQILGEPNATKRSKLLSGSGLNLHPETRATLNRSLHLTFCQALALNTDNKWTADVVNGRTRGLAERMWDFLWPWLQ